LLSITGGRIERVACMGNKPDTYVMEGIVTRPLETAVMYNSENVVFNVRTGFCTPHGKVAATGAHCYNIRGTAGSVEYYRSELPGDKPKKWTVKNGWEEAEWTVADPAAKEYIKNSPHGGTDGYPIEYFADAILNDTEPPMDVYKSVETAAPAILAAESSEKGGVMLEVPDFRPQRQGNGKNERRAFHETV
jgi:hypothetical protein